MKRFLLFGLSAFMAQSILLAQEPGEPTAPVFGPEDPKVIFMQDFEPSSEGMTAEQAWEEWQQLEIDQIDELTYYKRQGSGTLSGTNIYNGSTDWEIAYVRTDSVMKLTNGIWGNVGEDKFSIQTDGFNTERASAFKAYAEDGGDYFFRYTSANGSGAANYSNGVVPNYSRNLFVRGLPIEDNTSYRLTVFVKARSVATVNKTTPTFYADVMRGYFNSEKPFSMDQASGSGKFEYTKSDFTGEWEKITFMTYYLNDSIADCFMYGDGYWWDGGWTWNHEDGNTYRYIKQPDKFFTRLSFASDSTEFEIDNLSLTKSWIAGAQHASNMLRVDFGYETNLKDLAKAAYAETNISSVELPGEYFDVYGKLEDDWWPIEIASAEYHDDGYMYMWSMDLEDGTPNLFEYYDSVIVNFTNPVDNDAICLKYTGSLYPNALDAEWVANGKKVMNFVNERSTLNPNIMEDKNGKPVYSMKQLPPVITELPYENGSFGLKSIDEITVGMSKEIQFDDQGELSEYAFLRVTKSGFKEIWTVKESTESSATFVRSTADIAKNGSLSGTLQFEFVALKGEATDYRTPNPVVNYDFGEFDTNPDPNPAPIMKTNFGSEYDLQCIPLGYNVWDGVLSFADGKGYRTSGIKSRLYPTVPDDENGQATTGFYLSSRGQAAGGHLYYGFDDHDSLKLKLAPGSYNLNFRAAQWDGYPIPITVSIFPRSATDNPQTNPVSDENRIMLGTFTPTVTATSGNIQNSNPESRTWPNEPFSFSFTISKDDYYVIEWHSAMGESGNAKSYGGMMMTDFNITPGLGLSYSYVIKLNQAVADAEAMLESAAENKYRGADYDAFKVVIDEYKTWQNTAPSKYDAATALVKDATKQMELRMDTVNLFYTTETNAFAKLAEYADSEDGYNNLATYKSLDSLCTANEEWDCSQKTSGELTAEIKEYNDVVAALDARIELIGKYNGRIDEIKALIDAEDAHKEYEQYEAMVAYHAEALEYNRIEPSNDELDAEYIMATDVKNAYTFRIDGSQAGSVQIRELFTLAETLGYEFGGKRDSIEEVVFAMEALDSAMYNVLREASILQLYKKLATTTYKDTLNLDITPIIPNYNIVTTATTDQFVNSNGKWRISAGTNTAAIPAWNVSFAGANWQSGAWYPGKAAMDWGSDAHTFIAGVHFEPNTTGSATVTVPGLPAAIYSAKMILNQNNISNSRIDAVSDSVTIEVKGTKSTGKQTFTAENVWVPKKSDLKISYTITGASGSGHVDVTSAGLVLVCADSTVDYTEYIAAQEAKLSELVTFVPVATQSIDVQYFNLSGVQIVAPKSGEIVIRRTLLGNGKVKTEKVFVK